MKLLAALFAVLLAGCAVPAPAPAPSGLRQVPLKNAGFEDPPAQGERCAPSWSCPMHADPNSFRYVLEGSRPAAGARSLCVERVTREPWALLIQGFEAMPYRGKTLRLSAAVRVENLTGDGAGLFAKVTGPVRVAHAGYNLIKTGPEWQRLTLDFPVAADAMVVDVGGTLEGGGKACFDDVRLEVAFEGMPGL